MSSFVLGIDGGGTRTRAAAVGMDGRVGIGLGGSSNYDDVGVGMPNRTSTRPWTWQRRQPAWIAPPALRSSLAWVALPPPPTRSTFRDTAARTCAWPHRRASAWTTTVGLLAGGLEGRPGIVQIIGTGSSTYGRNAGGESWMAGGRGHLIADEGSGYWLGVAAMRVAVRAYDGRGAPTPLPPQFSQRWGSIPSRRSCTAFM